METSNNIQRLRGILNAISSKEEFKLDTPTNRDVLAAMKDSGVGRCLILGGPNFFSDVYMYTLCVHMSVFYVCKAQEKFLKLKFVL